MSETPQRNENETIQINYTGDQINDAIGAALDMKSGGMAAKKAECDGKGNNIQNTYTTKNEANQIRQDMNEKVDKSRILQYIDYTKDETNKTVTITGIKTGISRTDLVGDFVIPETIEGYSVISIGDSAFSGCTALTSITIPDSVTSIGNLAFSGCKGLTSVTIPDSVITIGSGAFAGCTGLTRITIPDSVTMIGSNMFSGCTRLTSVTIGNSVTSIGNGAFYNCYRLTSIIVPGSVTSIGYEAFYGCTGLTSVTIGDSVTTIRGSAFLGCTGLTSITIPDSLTAASIGNEAFRGCNSIQTIYYGGTQEQWERLSNRPNVVSGGHIYYNQKPAKMADVEQRIKKNQCLQYLDWELMEDGNIQILGVKQGTPSSALEGMTLYIPDLIDGKTVTSIAEGAFDSYWEFSSVIIPDSITTINNYAFVKCTGLTFVMLPSSLITMGEGAFADCVGLSSITIPRLTTILDDTFSGCTGLTSITIPDSVTSIGWGAFSGCTGLTKIIIPDSVTTIGKRAFYDCEGLTEIIISDSVTTIGDGAFQDCKSLTSVVIGDGVTSIGEDIFKGCISLANVKIKEGTKLLTPGMFSNCAALESISIPSSIEGIAMFAFTGCNSIQTIYYGGTEIQWNRLANHPNVVSGGHIYFNQKLAVKQDIYDYHDDTKQDKTDNSLQTISKNVVEAINELNTNKQDTIAEIQNNHIIFDDKKVVFLQVPMTDLAPENEGDLTTKSYVDYEISNYHDDTKQDKNDNSLQTTNKSVVGAINELKGNVNAITDDIGDLFNQKQDKSDPFLHTNSKTVTGAINELNTNKQDNIAEVQTNYIVFDDKKVVFLQAPMTDQPPENEGDLTTKSYVDYEISNYHDETKENIIRDITPYVDITPFIEIQTIQVDTYALLEQEDKTSLANNDIAKVAQDETHNNNTTYYMFSITRNANPSANPPISQDGIWIYCGDKDSAIITNLKSGVEKNSLIGRFKIPETITIYGVARTVTTIGADCFNNCVNADFILPNTLTTIQSRAFRNTNISEVNLNRNVTIGGNAFAVCQNIQNVFIPCGAQLSSAVFANCYNIKSVEAEDGNTTMGQNTFIYCNNLKYVKLPESITNLGNATFGSTSLMKLYIPKNVNSITINAFSNPIVPFTDIYFGGKESEWNNYNFTSRFNWYQEIITLTGGSYVLKQPNPEESKIFVYNSNVTVRRELGVDYTYDSTTNSIVAVQDGNLTNGDIVRYNTTNVPTIHYNCKPATMQDIYGMTLTDNERLAILASLGCTVDTDTSSPTYGCVKWTAQS